MNKLIEKGEKFFIKINNKIFDSEFSQIIAKKDLLLKIK